MLAGKIDPFRVHSATRIKNIVSSTCVILMSTRIQKLYHSIGEISERLNLEPHVLRYWETEFPMLAPRKNRSGRRAYTDDDIRLVERIQYLLRDEKYTIEGARQVLEREAASGADTHKDTDRDHLIELRRFLAELRGSMD